MRASVLSAVLFLALGPRLGAQTGMSRQLQSAVEHFEKGEDLEAMDLFMEVLTRGDPGERPIANEYLNTITQRMASGDPHARVLGGAKAPAAALAPTPKVSGAPEPAEEASAPSRGPEHQPERRVESVGAPREEGSRSADLLQDEIRRHLDALTRGGLQKLGRYEDLRLQVEAGDRPKLLALPSGLLFESEVQFKKDVGKLLEALTELLYGLGSAQVTIFPEGALTGDPKVTDMRRAMALSSYFMQAGIAPARVRTHLLQPGSAPPREFSDSKGLLLSFAYPKVLVLNGEGVSEEQGPPISLGAYPRSLRAGKGGLVLEFSVAEPPSGLKFWKFQLLGPGRNPGDDMLALQEVSGSAQALHQIYWNGRRADTGELYPPGQYEAVLTAIDGRHRSSTKHVWIALSPPAPVPAAPQRAASAPAGPKPVTLRRAPRTPKPAGRPQAAARAPDRTEERPPEKEPSVRTGVVNHQIRFAPGEAEIGSEAEAVLGRVADAMEYYPLDGVNVIGYAPAAEPGALALATRRAEAVKRFLAEKHGKDPRRMRTQGKVEEGGAHKAEIYIVAGNR